MKIIRKSAVISKDKLYRYQLLRHWDRSNWKRVVFLMLNPSTADYKLDDPTIKSCCAIANNNGYGGILVVNLFAFRATKPRNLFKAEDPVGLDNNKWIVETCKMSDKIICGWGNKAPPHRVNKVLGLINYEDLYCIQENSSGSPKHPLYCKRDSIFKPWDDIPF